MYTTLWEIPALAIINELRSRTAMKEYGPFTLDVLYARAKAKLWAKVERLKRYPDIRISDFGTRRRHSFLWQRWCVEALKEGIGDSFTGTSNVKLAMDTDLEALGTNAHELPMVAAALATTDAELMQAPYNVRDGSATSWRQLLIVLPDAFGTASFLRKAPDWIAEWTGASGRTARRRSRLARRSSNGGAPGERTEEQAADLFRRPRRRGDRGTFRHFRGKVRMAFGWGTNLTNDFEDCAPTATPGLTAISLVCKVTSANGRPAVKLSDNPAKATGDPREIARYIKLFGETDRVRHAVKV